MALYYGFVFIHLHTFEVEQRVFSLIQLLPKPLQKHVIQTSAMYSSCAVHFQTGKKEVLLLSALVAVVTLRVNCWTERGMTWFVLHYKR